jgi:hypothetical protein
MQVVLLCFRIGKKCRVRMDHPKEEVEGDFQGEFQN